MLSSVSNCSAQSKYRSHYISLSDITLVADMTGALYWPSKSMLIIADMHLEKGSSFAVRGQLLPPYDTRDTLLRLAQVINFYQAQTIVALGDSFHDKKAFDRIGREDLEILRQIQIGRNWIWIRGNHDPQICSAAGGECLKELLIQGLTLRHEPNPVKGKHEIAGHMHPVAKLKLYGHSLRLSCFVLNQTRLVMPAFGSYTGGLNVLDPAFIPLFGNDELVVWVQGEQGLYPIAKRMLRKDYAAC